MVTTWASLQDRLLNYYIQADLYHASKAQGNVHLQQDLGAFSGRSSEQSL